MYTRYNITSCIRYPKKDQLLYITVHNVIINLLGKLANNFAWCSESCWDDLRQGWLLTSRAQCRTCSRELLRPSWQTPGNCWTLQNKWHLFEAKLANNTWWDVQGKQNKNFSVCIVSPELHRTTGKPSGRSFLIDLPRTRGHTLNPVQSGFINH